MAYWYFPSNKNVFDMVRCLNERDEIDQPFFSHLVKRTANVGDIVFVYVTEPFGQILYKMEVTEVFGSFDDVNQGRWAKYAGRGVAPSKGHWARLRFLDNSEPAHRPLQPAGLRANDIHTSAGIYPLSREKAAYIESQFAASKAN
ncbi:MAG: hypothetical protein NC301_08800 [Bacteroides sp.]|nr:hypothetical protein [Alistipes timonensis]MCM1311101.1 hypothetical protein [Bacteroides sp.]MCM1404812.1 hypothetical protein [[Clostridium] fimetarium]